MIHSLYGDAKQSPNDKLCRLLFFIGALKDAGAERVTAIVPYLCCARKDRRTQPRDPVTTKYVAGLFEACRTDAMITVDVHNLAAFENAFHCPSTYLEAVTMCGARRVRATANGRPTSWPIESTSSAAPAPSAGVLHYLARMTALGALRSAQPTDLRSSKIVGSSSLTVG